MSLRVRTKLSSPTISLSPLLNMRSLCLCSNPVYGLRLGTRLALREAELGAVSFPVATNRPLELILHTYNVRSQFVSPDSSQKYKEGKYILEKVSSWLGVVLRFVGFATGLAKLTTTRLTESHLQGERLSTTLEGGNLTENHRRTTHGPLTTLPTELASPPTPRIVQWSRCNGCNYRERNGATTTLQRENGVVSCDTI